MQLREHPALGFAQDGFSDRDLATRTGVPAARSSARWAREPSARAPPTSRSCSWPYERLGSAWASAAVLLAETLPGMFAGPLIGAWLDRRDPAPLPAIAQPTPSARSPLRRR